MMYSTRPALITEAALLPAIERSAGALFRQIPELAWISDGDVQSAEQHAKLIVSGTEWVAVNSDNVPVGFLSGEEIGGRFHIWEMSVHDAHQRYGLGSKLINHAKLFAIERGYPALTLTTFRDVKWNEGFYARIGFRVIRNDELSNELMQILTKEVESGLPGELRCAMSMELDAKNLFNDQ
jgi:GNAT superfamily N-acetyltransferase